MQKNQITIFKSYMDEEQEIKFQAFMENEKLSLEIKGEHHGLELKPLSGQHHNIETIAHIKDSIQAFADSNYARHQPVANMSTIQAIRKKATEQTKVISNKTNDLEIKIAGWKQEKKKYFEVVSNKKFLWILFCIPIILGTTEGLSFYSLLSTASVSFFTAISLSLMITVVSAVSVYLSASYITKAQTKQGKTYRYMMVCVVALIVASCISLWRANLSSTVAKTNVELSNGNINDIPIFSPYLFALFSFLAFFVAVAFEVKYYRTEVLKQKELEFDMKGKEAQAMQKELEQLLKQRKEIEAETAQASESALHQFEYAKSFEQRLISSANQLLSHYECTNLRFRNDDSCPLFFGQKTDWQFKLYFTTFLTNQNK